MMGSAHPQATSKMITVHIIDKLQVNLNLRLKYIIINFQMIIKNKNKKTHFQMEYGAQVSHRKGHIAKEKVMKEMCRSFEEPFNQIKDYCIELYRTNPATKILILRRLDGSFHRFFWLLGGQQIVLQKPIEAAHCSGWYTSLRKIFWCSFCWGDSGWRLQVIFYLLLPLVRLRIMKLGNGS